MFQFSRNLTLAQFMVKFLSVGSNFLVGFGSIWLMKFRQYPFTVSVYRSQVWSRKVQRK
jgi:hypothetical protein